MKRFLNNIVFVGIALWACLLLCDCSSVSTATRKMEYVNPLNYGLAEATTGQERYNVLLQCHQDAVNKNMGVSYAGIDSIFLEIPKGAKTIPITDYTDFAGATLHVLNQQKNCYLFTYSPNLKSIVISGAQIDKQDFHESLELSSGLKLLVISDKNLWVENRIGYSYGATRKDVVLVRNGVASNAPVQSYCTESSSPQGSYREVSPYLKEFKNVVFTRDAASSYKTYLVKFENEYNVKLSSITINTPKNDKLYGDAAITMNNCAYVSLKDIIVNGTYSLTKQYGYGVNMDNIYDLKVENMYARANWGVFGNNNMNKVKCVNCDINRFDIHCYGRDVEFVNSSFVDLYNQFSSLFGTLTFSNCTFTNCVPVLIESSYNAYTPFDLIFKECTFNLSSSKNYLMTLMSLSSTINSRPELSRKCLPNISLTDCHVNLADGVKNWYIIKTGNVTYTGQVDYISQIKIDNLQQSGAPAKLNKFTQELKTCNEIKMEVK